MQTVKTIQRLQKQFPSCGNARVIPEAWGG